MTLAIVHVTAEHAADDVRITARELTTLLTVHPEAWIVARPARGPVPPGLHVVEGPAYRRASRPQLDWPALDAAVRRTPEPRLVHTHEPATALAARRFAWCRPEHLIHDVHEYHGAMTAHRATGLRRLALRLIGDRQHAGACRAASRGAVIAVNDELAVGARRHGARRVEVLTNAPLLGPPSGADSGHDSGAGQRDPLRLVYVGGVSEPRGVRTMFEAFERIRTAQPEARLDVVGPPLDAVARAALDAAPPGVVVHGARPPGATREIVRSASIGLIPFERVVHYRGRPVKLLEYALEGLTVVATAGGPKEAWIREHRAGAVVPPGDPAAMAAACLERLADPELARAEGERGAAAADAAAWERSEAPRLLALYAELLTERA